MFKFFKKQNQIESPDELLELVKPENTLPDLDFKSNLKMQMIQKMNPPKRIFPFSIRYLYAVPALLLTIVIIWGVLSFIGGDSNLISPTSSKQRLKIAASEISVTSTMQDTLGIDPKSDFTIKTTIPVEEEDLKNALSTNSNLEFKLNEVSDKEYTVSFEEDLKANKIVNFAVATVNDMGETKDLSWAFQVKAPFRVLSALPANSTSGIPINSGIEVVFSHSNFQDPAKFFEITPNVKGKFERYGRTLAFIPEKLEQGKVYKVTIKNGLGLDGTDEKLAEDYSFSFETGSEEFNIYDYNYFNFSKDFYEFTPNENPIFGVTRGKDPNVDTKVFSFTNVDEFTKGIQAFTSIPSWAYVSKTLNKYDTSKIKKVFEGNIPIEGDNDWSGYLSLPQKLSEGYYLLEAQNGKLTIQTWFQVTNVSGVLTTSEKEGLIWLIDKETKKPISNASISLAGDPNTKFPNTDKNGLSTFTTPTNLLKNQESDLMLFVAKTNNRQIVLPASSTTRDYYYYDEEYDGYYYESGLIDDYWLYLYTDRTIYKPSDKLHFWGIIRPRDSKVSPEQKYHVAIESNSSYTYNYEPIEVVGMDVTADKLGNIIGELKFENLAIGYYTLTIKDSDKNIINSTSFEVTASYKPAYMISAQTDKKAYFVGEKIKLTGQAQYFEGTPVSGVELKISKAGEVKTDVQGTFLSEFVASYPYSDYPRLSDYQTAVINPKLSEIGEISGSANYRVFTRKTDIDLEVKENGLQRSLSVKLNEIDLSRLNNSTAKNPYDYIGKSRGNQPIRVEIKESWYESYVKREYYDPINKITRKEMGYIQKEQQFMNSSYTTDSNGKAQVSFEIKANRYYTIKVFTQDLDGKEIFDSTYISGYQYFSNNKYANLYYSLQTDMPEDGYSLNDKMNINLTESGNKVELKDNDLVLYITSQIGITNAEVLNSSTLEKTFTSDLVPNAYIKAIYYDGNIFNETSNQLIKINKADKNLDISFKADKQKYAPGEEIILDLQLKDKDGKAKKGTLNLSVIDEALASIDTNDLDILDAIYRNVSSGIFQTYLSHYNPQIQPGGGMGDSCFLPGTKILMKGNTYKNIEDIKVGDYVLTKENENSDKFVEARVYETIKHEGSEYLLVNNHMRVTPIHVMYVNGRWMQAKYMKTGDYLLDSAGNWTVIENIKSVSGDFEVYDLNIENYHTYFAENYYVHNKQNERSVFLDTAFFNIVNTDNNGNANVKFTAPDNITSWRVSYQGITEDLFAGANYSNVNVSIPFFIDPLIEEIYLESDRPNITLKVFGDAISQKLISGDVTYTIESKSLGINQTLTGKILDISSFELPKLTKGSHQITISAKAGKYEDKIVKSFKVIDSYQSVVKTESQKLKSNLEFPDYKDLDGSVEIVFMNNQRAEYYKELYDLYYSYGNRVDQNMARKYAGEMLQKYFDIENYWASQPDLSNYQYTNGGIALLPYAEGSLELTVKAMDVNSDDFNAYSLESYLTSILEDKKEDRYRKIVALYGLAQLEVPVLNVLETLSQEKDLNIFEVLYLGLAQAELGNTQKALDLLNRSKDMLTDTDEEKSEAAGLKMMLAAKLQEYKVAHEMLQYINSNPKQNDLDYLEKLVFLQELLPYTETDKYVAFEYILNGKTEKVTLNDVETKKIVLTANEIKQIEFMNIVGEVTVTTAYQSNLVDSVTTSKNISVQRKYFVNNSLVNPKDGKINLKDGDLVTVELSYNVPSKQGCYTITDYLPSGMKLITRNASYWSDNSNNIDYPLRNDFQSVSFCAPKYEYRAIRYIARVSGKGTFTAEKPVVQSQQNPEIINFGTDLIVEIK